MSAANASRCSSEFEWVSAPVASSTDGPLEFSNFPHQGQSRAQEVGASAMNPSVVEPKSTNYRSSHGVHLTWPLTGDSSECPETRTSSPRGPEFDFVIVPGVYGNWRDLHNTGPGSGTTEWVSKYARRAAGSRILRFEYDAKSLFAGTVTASRDAIRQCALELMRGLSVLRKDEPRKRVICFVSHDFGGTIVKDTLVVASHLAGPARADIFDMTRVLIFQGCPHRCTSLLGMEERLGRFLSFSRENQTWGPPAISSIPNIVEATTEINALFIDSKVLLRAYAISVYFAGPCITAGSTDRELDPVTASFCLPLEVRLLQLVGDVKCQNIISHLDRISSALNVTYSDKLLRNERRILSLSSPIQPPKLCGHSGKLSFSVSRSQEYKDWLNHQGPSVLYVHGSADVQYQSEVVRFSLEQHAKARKTLVLYFTFDQYDVQRDSLSSMASTFLAQMICRFPHDKEWHNAFFTRMDFEQGWTDVDLLYWLDRYRRGIQYHDTIFVLNRFENCKKESRDLLISRFKEQGDSSETQWKMLLTSFKPGALVAELSGAPVTILDISAKSPQELMHDVVSNASAVGTAFEGATRPKTRDYTQQDVRTAAYGGFRMAPLGKPWIGPEIPPAGGNIFDRHADLLARTDLLAAGILYRQYLARLGEPDHDPAREGFDLSDLRTPGEWDDGLFASLLDKTLRGIREDLPVRLILSFICYAGSPLTLPELAAMVQLNTNPYARRFVDPTHDEIASFGLKFSRSFAGIAELGPDGVVSVVRRFRDIITGRGLGPGTGSLDETQTRHIWDGISDTAHHDITQICLRYLLHHSNCKTANRMCHVSATRGACVSTDRGTLYSYAVREWLHHFQRITSPSLRSAAAKLLQSRDIQRDLARGYAALQNPFTRSSEIPKGLYPLFAGLGLLDIVPPIDAADAALGLAEAAANGQTDTVKHLLLQPNEFDEAALLDALTRAGGFGNEELILHLIQHIQSNHTAQFNPKPISWPQNLLYRAATLNLPTLAETLLELGVPPSPEVPCLTKLRNMGALPLSHAARSGHPAIVKLLLKHGTSPDFPQFGANLLHMMAIASKPFSTADFIAIATPLIREGRLDVNAQDVDGRTALYDACDHGYFGIVEALLGMGANTDDVDFGAWTWSPIGVASGSGHLRCVRALRGAGSVVGFGDAAVKGEEEGSDVQADSGEDWKSADSGEEYGEGSLRDGGGDEIGGSNSDLGEWVVVTPEV